MLQLEELYWSLCDLFLQEESLTSFSWVARVRMGIHILKNNTWCIWSSVWRVSKVYDDSRGDLQINTRCDLVLLTTHTNFRLCQKWGKNFALHLSGLRTHDLQGQQVARIPHRVHEYCNMRWEHDYDRYVRIWKVKNWANINNPRSVSQHQKGRETSIRKTSGPARIWIESLLKKIQDYYRYIIWWFCTTEMWYVSPNVKQAQQKTAEKVINF